VAAAAAAAVVAAATLSMNFQIYLSIQVFLDMEAYKLLQRSTKNDFDDSLMLPEQ
jgi:hypothetical protein